ncbi:PTS transporter subunit EIIC [Companilactobacillus allii]|nr:PTS transporter subunit EIIC [Companilactobacillus allii]USQ68638.1 PTS transporter subunit EIIC [Companilactobacillus allii]
MGAKMQSFTNKIQSSMGKFASNKLLSAISNGMIRLLPVTMVGSVFAILGNLGFPGYQEFVNKIGFGSIFAMGVQMTTNLISIYVLISLAYEYSKKLNGSKVNSILLSVMSFFLLTPISNFKVKGSAVVGLDLTYLGSKGMFVAMIVSLSVTRLYCLLENKHITIKMPDSVPPAVSNSFTGLVPAWIIAGIVLVINGILRATPFGDIHDLVYTIVQTPLEHLGGSIWALLFILFFSEFLWFFGIHGSMATSAIIYTLYQPLELQNLAAYTAGQALPNILTKTFIDVMKGPRHFALALLLLFICRSHHMKSVGKVAIIPAIFGISEPMKFGIPMVLNPILFIPMTLSPVISVGLAYAATSLKLIPRMTGITFPWNIPVVSGLIVGDWRTAVLQVIQLFIAMALYYPFIKFLDRQTLEQEAEQVEKE